MALALGIPVHGVCTLDILAAEAVDAGLDDFLVATDARRKEVYLASYVGGRRDGDPQVVRPADVASDRTVVGRGAALYPEAFPNAAAPEHPSAGRPLRRRRARALRAARPRAALPPPSRRDGAARAQAGLVTIRAGDGR